MPRLIAIEGKEAGVALPITGPATYLTPGSDRRVVVAHGGTPPGLGAVVRTDDGTKYSIARVATDALGEPLQVNGREVEDGGAALNHGDLVNYVGTTLIFDTDDHQKEDTTPGSEREDRASSDADPGAILYRSKVPDDPDRVVVTPGAADSLRLATMVKFATALGGTLDLGELLTALVDMVFEILPASRGTVLLFDPRVRRLRSMVGKVRGQPAVQGTHVPVSRTIIREALRAREAILTGDARTDARFSGGESIVASGICSALCVPIVRRGKVLGLIHLDTVAGAPTFDRDDVEMLAAVSGVAALAIENARLFQQAAERERMRYELHLASAIQQRLLPKGPPEARGLSVFGLMRPAKELGGDLYDFVGTEDGSVHVFVGDVSGKGVGASLIMAMARSYFRPLTLQHRSPRRLMVEMNRLLFNDTDADKFMSAIHLFWDARRQRLVWCGAGQEHLLIYRAGKRTCEAVPAGGVALAVVEDADQYLEERELHLGPGDAVVLYSDGVIDARCVDGSFFRLDRLEELVTEVGSLESAHEIVARVVDSVQRFVGVAEPHDDVTVVALKRMGSP